MSRKSTKRPAARQSRQEASAYIGPSIRGVAASGTVYTGELPASLNKKINEVPVLKGLIIPVSELAEKSAEVRRPGSALNTLYKTAASALQ